MPDTTVMESNNAKGSTMFNEGQKVSGKFFGVDFTGVVKHRWFNEANHRMVAYNITLDSKISALGEEREEITATVEITSGRDSQYNTEISGV